MNFEGADKIEGTMIATMPLVAPNVTFPAAFSWKTVIKMADELRKERAEGEAIPEGRDRGRSRTRTRRSGTPSRDRRRSSRGPRSPTDTHQQGSSSFGAARRDGQAEGERRRTDTSEGRGLVRSPVAVPGAGPKSKAKQNPRPAIAGRPAAALPAASAAFFFAASNITFVWNLASLLWHP